MKTRTEITFEMDRLIVLNRPRRSESCPSCSRPVEMQSVDDAALVKSLLELLKERRDEECSEE